MQKSKDLSRSLEINIICTFDMDFPNIFNKTCTYITFKSTVKHRQLSYSYISCIANQIIEKCLVTLNIKSCIITLGGAF